MAPPEKIAAACDKNTIGVVGILGTTYSGHYEDVAGIDAEISESPLPCPHNGVSTRIYQKLDLCPSVTSQALTSCLPPPRHQHLDVWVSSRESQSPDP